MSTKRIRCKGRNNSAYIFVKYTTQVHLKIKFIHMHQKIRNMQSLKMEKHNETKM